MMEEKNPKIGKIVKKINTLGTNAPCQNKSLPPYIDIISIQKSPKIINIIKKNLQIVAA